MILGIDVANKMLLTIIFHIFISYMTNPCIKCFYLTKYHVGAGAKVSWCSSETHEDPDLGSSDHSGSQEDPAWYFQVPVAGGPRLRLRGGPALWGESDPQL